MSNKRVFKKYADAIGASVCESMMSTYYNTEEVNKETIEKAIAKVLGATGAAKSNANVTFDKGVKAFGSLEEYSKAKKDFYKKLFVKISDDFNSELDEALKLFNSAIPEEVKAAQKKSTAE
ncbi:MAG: hypothetical protein K2J82_05870 [Muribaculaceae bacterium]|nr:hypothetical protein [Muribaculaceae bacterium]MDE6754123.1 hypothetical protein [Muribaculaceae bacterium]